MNEKTLSDAIDRAAKVRAEQILKDALESVRKALKPHWRVEVAGGRYIHDEIIPNVVGMLTAENMSMYKPIPTSNLIDICRAAIVNEMMTGMENLRKLNEFASQHPEADQYDLDGEDL